MTLAPVFDAKPTAVPTICLRTLGMGILAIIPLQSAIAQKTDASISVQRATGQKTEQIVITEPGVYKLADLFNKADTVALVKIVSGDAESYDAAVYKATVLKSFKGTASGKTIYFGPYIGERIGWEYVLFLRNASKVISPQTSSNSGFGTVDYAEVFNEGYSSMMASYECVCDGNTTD
jgi:hypothetical protein